MSAVITVLTKLELRNMLIVENVMKLITKNYKIMVFSDRREHCVALKAMFEENNIAAGLYIGGMKKSELEDSTNCVVLLTTYSMAKEGIDLPDFDALLLSTPRSDVVQACGRVLHAKTVRSPIIIDIVDNWTIGKAQYGKRVIYYKKSGFTVCI